MGTTHVQVSIEILTAAAFEPCEAGGTSPRSDRGARRHMMMHDHDRRAALGVLRTVASVVPGFGLRPGSRNPVTGSCLPQDTACELAPRQAGWYCVLTSKQRRCQGVHGGQHNLFPSQAHYTQLSLVNLFYGYL